ncbi:hypothetical protein L1887_23154 [Cichorium endivia]|nr:hypothetical protein L1887_23150 [Cichorium endivia]KAI3508151.1 hypothetical protein L1887_23154 [Cichorium endivia]
MGAAWPVLGESTKALKERAEYVIKLQEFEEAKILDIKQKARCEKGLGSSFGTRGDGLLPPALHVKPQVTGSGNSSSPHKHSSPNNVNSTSPQNHAAPTRQRSMKRGGGNSTANRVVSQPPPTSQDLAVENPHNTSFKTN